ncbi:ADP-ribosylation factor-like protein 13B [Trichinella pseudospiralis]|uniref:ADP-ribosylation factor-like protein 13B n=1 Tax=Trichinella pseudospiralis TaxID=6337 RepID=A0A0V0XMZ3_TRIPS|nr:ADP-ribosylation factor-like protein 13B [Trichinella pseudospiralis]
MGNCSTNRGPKRKITVAVLGLDNAGKTSLLKCLSRESSGVSMPTIGFSKCVIQMRNYMVTFYDLGGSSGIRDIWKNYYAEIHGLIFVIDGSDWTRTEENRIVLGEVLNHEWIHGKPLLVIINKHDLNPDVNELILAEQLQLRRFAYNAQCPYTSANDVQRGEKVSTVQQKVEKEHRMAVEASGDEPRLDQRKNPSRLFEPASQIGRRQRKTNGKNTKIAPTVSGYFLEETEKHRSVAITTVKTVRFTLSVEQDNSENQSNTEESLELEKYADVSKFDQQQVAETADNINDKTGNDDDIANDDSKRCVRNVNSEEHWKRSINNSTETNVRKRKRKRLARFHRVQPMDNK